MPGTRCAAFRQSATWEKPQGKNEPLKMEKRYRVVPRGIGPRHRLQYLSDLERLPGPVRQPRHRQRGHRQAASERDPAARHQRADRARGALRSGLRPERGDAGGARRRRRHGAEARAAPRGQAHRLHRQQRQRRVARAQRPSGPGLHREGGGRIRSSSTPRPTSRPSPATSPSRLRSIPARCAPRRRTSTCRAAASTPPRAI